MLIMRSFDNTLKNIPFIQSFMVGSDQQKDNMPMLMETTKYLVVLYALAPKL